MAHQAGVSEGPIRLAHVPPFRLGAITVHPPTRQVTRDGRSETLEPRVMQVLVALAQAEGAILTRDELIERCWAGRIVSENAINRAISRVRQVAAEFGGASFRLETVTRVGYRIVADGAPRAGGRATAEAKAVDRRFALGAAAMVAAGFAGAWFWTASRPDRARSEAQALVRKGRELQGYGLPDRVAQAVAYFREATRIDPAYAEGWGALALGEDDPARKRSAAARALALDPANADAQAALILIRPQFGNWSRCEADYRGHLRRFPNHKWVQWALANLLCEVGRWRDAIAVLSEVAARNPFLPLVGYRLINALWSAGRLQEADNALADALARWPHHSAIWQTRFRILTYTGRAEAALAFANDPDARPLDGDMADFEPTIAAARALASGHPADAETAVALNLRKVERQPDFVTAAALNCAGLNRLDDAFALYRGYYFASGRWARTKPRNPSHLLTLFLFYPVTASLRRDRRFRPLVEEIGLEHYWRAARIPPDYRRLA